MDSKYAIIATWNFEQPIKTALNILESGGDAIAACLEGCRHCQELKCGGSVGYGGSPNQNGETTLDAMIMNGNNMRVGCVGSLRNIKDAIGVAYDIMMKTKHSFLVGSEATEFAVKLGYKFENVSSKTSKKEYSEWKSNNCEPNYWNDKIYSPTYNISSLSPKALDKGHDTIGFVSLDLNGLMAAATSTNGMKFKIPGRIGDSPIPGAGSYVNSKIGGAAATGDGDVLMRFMPSYQAVEFLSQGLSPNQAASMALKRIIEFEKYFSGAIVVLSKSGEHGASSFGFDNFSYYYASDIIQSPILISVTPMST